MILEGDVMDQIDKEILMELQYDFPLHARPYDDIANKVGIGLQDLLESINNLINEKPYDFVLKKYDLKEEELEYIIKKLLEKGVLADPGAALDGEKLGFKENGMVVMEPNGNEELICECAASMSFSTHVVLRQSIPEGKWKHVSYAMVHATEKKKIEDMAKTLKEKCNPRDLMIIYSLADLKPGVVR